ncbi:hypothetical protein MY04_3282 [Flammeovirga sp. MY04]|uniref:hypothetical protein n=1 Tax=Flammeovirga sp. MY04 TaxID=1191459 RepID=UPI0008060D3A|nr:hypothetical protein [Flammeovirga sp. MY04]ANQ50644.1 hypothetical protein MY04_3282 [Flammeovirga sp. MY04]
MKNLSIIILTLLSFSFISCDNNDNGENPSNDPSISIDNKQEVLEVYPLQPVELDVLAKTNSSAPISDIDGTPEGSCMESQDTTLNANEGYLNYNQSAPYNNGEYVINFTAYTDEGKTANVNQQIRVVGEPFIMQIDSTEIPDSAFNGANFTVRGTLKSVLPFNGTSTSVDVPGQTGIQFSTSVLEGAFDAVVDNTPAEIPHSARTAFEVKSHSLEKDSNGYYTYNFEVTYTVTRPGVDSELPQNEFTINITYNYFDSTVKCISDADPMFGTWSKTVIIQDN